MFDIWLHPLENLAFKNLYSLLYKIQHIMVTKLNFGSLIHKENRQLATGSLRTSGHFVTLLSIDTKGVGNKKVVNSSKVVDKTKVVEKTKVFDNTKVVDSIKEGRQSWPNGPPSRNLAPGGDTKIFFEGFPY